MQICGYKYTQVVSPAPQGFPQNQLAQKSPAHKLWFGSRWTTSSVTSNRSIWELPSLSFFRKLIGWKHGARWSSTQPLSERQCVETIGVGQFASPETTAADVLTWHGLKHLRYTKLLDVNDLSLKNAFKDRNGLVLPRWDSLIHKDTCCEALWRCWSETDMFQCVQYGPKIDTPRTLALPFCFGSNWLKTSMNHQQHQKLHSGVLLTKNSKFFWGLNANSTRPERQLLFSLGTTESWSKMLRLAACGIPHCDHFVALSKPHTPGCFHPGKFLEPLQARCAILNSERVSNMSGTTLRGCMQYSFQAWKRNCKNTTSQHVNTSTRPKPSASPAHSPWRTLNRLSSAFSAPQSSRKRCEAFSCRAQKVTRKQTGSKNIKKQIVA